MDQQALDMLPVSARTRRDDRQNVPVSNEYSQRNATCGLTFVNSDIHRYLKMNDSGSCANEVAM